MAVVVTRSSEPVDGPQIEALIALAADHDGRPPLSEQKLHDLHRGPGHESNGVVAHHEAELVGYAQLSASSTTWGLEVVIHPQWRHQTEIRLLLVETAVDLALAQRALPLHYWVGEPSEADDVVASGLGFVADRDLLQMTVALPLAEQPSFPSATSVRAFEVGRDETAWLAVNNRAFADHPEQGGWTIETLRAREDEPWFEPAGFLLAEENDELLGSCWTKIHHETEPAVGEIYVISVDPAAHGRGLGRALTVAGLSWLAAQGLSVGMLYTTASNVAAVHLYQALGFEIRHLDRVYVLTPTKRPTV